MADNGIIEQAIRETEERTRRSDNDVIERLRKAGRDTKAPPRYAQLLSAAQALLTGQSRRALDRRVEVAPYASWGPWIEGLPFAHALMLNEGVIVDLIPCRDEAAFVRTYRCSPEQFLELADRVIETRGEIRFNIRDYNPARPESLDAYLAQPDFLRSIYVYALEDGAAQFYLNSVRRESLLTLLGANQPMQHWRDALGGAGTGAKDDQLYRRLERLLAPANTDRIARQPAYRGVLVRGGGLPAPVQSFERMVYHLAFADLCPDDIPPDETVQRVAKGLRDGTTVTDDELLRACARANDLHHLYTAPITGAYGGTYNLTEHEFAPEQAAEAGEASEAKDGPAARQAASQNPAFLDFLYGAVSDRIRVRNDRLEALHTLGRQVSVMQVGKIPQDEELRAFLDFLPEARGFLRKRRELQAALSDCIRRGNGDLSSVDSYVAAADKAYRSCNGFWSRVKGHLFIGGGVALGGAGVGGIAAFGVPLGFLGDVLCRAYESYRPRREDVPQPREDAGDAAMDGVERKAGPGRSARDWIVERLVYQPCDRRQIVTIMDSLRG